jgi:hypothetical protein
MIQPLTSESTSMKKQSPSRRKLTETLSALMLATALVAPAPAVLAADAPATTAKDSKKAENPCGPGNPCGPAKKKKKKTSENPCAPSNPCAPKK